MGRQWGARRRADDEAGGKKRKMHIVVGVVKEGKGDVVALGLELLVGEDRGQEMSGLR